MFVKCVANYFIYQLSPLYDMPTTQNTLGPGLKLTHFVRVEYRWHTYGLTTVQSRLARSY